MPRLIDADKLKRHYSWWGNENQETFDTIVDLQPTVITETELKELEDRFGNKVRFVVEDMINGTGKRWGHGTEGI